MMICLLLGLLVGGLIMQAGRMTMDRLSTDEYCISCHVHTHADNGWRISSHYSNKSGTVTHCVDCHLPPKDHANYLPQKAKAGIHSLYTYYFKDLDKINWESKSQLEHAVDYTYDASCVKCHQNLFPLELSREGDEAHLYYQQNKDKLRCINCHLGVGHSKPGDHKSNMALMMIPSDSIVSYTQSARVDKFRDYTEQIPGTGVSFDMICVPGGSYRMGGVNDDSYVRDDEKPAVEVNVSSFFMGKIEVTWNEYLSFLRDTESEGRMHGEKSLTQDVDAITGATPPFGDPGQGWGMGKRPAITMTWHGAMTYCKWLSKKTGKIYRLPTEAEWEYACRAGSVTPYFFDGTAQDYTRERLWNRLFGTNNEEINKYVIYRENSMDKTQLPSVVESNPLGLLNMLGNVREMCLDWYTEDAYGNISGKKNPQGPSQGKEHVVRGGSFKSDAVDVRCSARDYTQHDKWLRTDPQIPKSIWWYSDCNDVGFRVVCEWPSKD